MRSFLTHLASLPPEARQSAVEAEIDRLQAELLTLSLAEQYRRRGQIGLLLRKWRWYQIHLPAVLSHKGKGAHEWRTPKTPDPAPAPDLGP